MRWVYYGVALAATVLACLLWLVVFGTWPGASSVPTAAAAPRFAPPGRLPVPPVLRPADEMRVALLEDLQDGRAVCLGGFYARPRRTVDGYAYDVVVLVGSQKVPCP